jgi:hypothetical protein
MACSGTALLLLFTFFMEFSPTDEVISRKLTHFCTFQNPFLLSSCLGSTITCMRAIFKVVKQCMGEPGISVSIVSGYGLDHRAIEVRSPAEAKGFFL